MRKSLIAFVLFLLFLRVGVFYSELKPLWNDELFTQVNSVEKLSYGQILGARVPEGNNHPLFYVLQKGFCDLTGYRLPFEWRGEWHVGEPTGQIILRVLPNFFMTLALLIIFYKFSGEYSYAVGLYALGIAFSTPTVWQFWVEARPYGLWFLLSTLQIFLFRDIVRQPSREKKWLALSVVHVLLSLTIFFGVIQIAIVSALLLIFTGRRFNDVFLLCGIPLLLGFYYFTQTPKYHFNLSVHWIMLITDNLSWDRLGLLVVGGSWIIWQRKAQKSSVIFLILAGSLIFLAGLLLMAFHFMSNPAQQRFEIANRYFLFLAPLGIVGVPLLAAELFEMLRQHVWLALNLMVVLVGFLLLRLVQIAPFIVSILRY